MSLMNMSFSGAVFIIAIMLIRAIAINRLPKKTFLVLWMLALVRLLVPFSVPSMFSVYTLIRGNESTPAFSVTEADNIVQDTPPLNPIATLQRTEQLQQGTRSSVSLLFAVWCAGMILLAIFFAVSYLRCLREFQTALPVHDPYAEQWLKKHPLKRKLLIKQTDQISAPLTYGIFHPVILMPKTTDWANKKELQFVLTHEYVHICRFDTVTKLMMLAALCVHWFNPFVWVMYLLFNRDIELACDESVLRLLGIQSKSDYSLMLIHMEAKKSGLLPLCNNFSKNAIEERITAIIKTKKTTIFSLVLACLIVVGTATAFITSAKATDQASVETADIEWWTYNEYKEWLENEKVQLQSMIGEKGYTGGRGEFVWTQEIVDETIAMYENILEDIKNGWMISKPDDGSDGVMMMQGNVSESSVRASDFTEYDAFGLKWNNDKKVLSYKGKRVRYFFDGVELGNGNGQAIKLEYTDHNLEGEIDVYTVRQRIDNGDGSVDLMGPLTGLAEYSQKEFDERVLLPASLSAEAEGNSTVGMMRGDIDTVTEETAVTEDTGTDGSTTFAEKFAKYQAYGITYVESDGERNVYYNGKLVHNFADVTPDGGAFSFTSSKDGGISIKTIYADGRLCGIEQMER